MSALGLSSYRKILRSVHFVFKNDMFAIQQAKMQLRAEFMKNSSVTDPDALEVLYKGVDEVDEMLRFNIVQGTMNERGNFDVDLSSEEKKTTVEAHQDLPHGVDLEPIDKSVTGKSGDVVIQTTKNRSDS
jgi:hypothetical protein